MNLDSVKRTLKSLGLELGSVDEEYSDSVPRGEVISQSPNANESVDKGSKVNVTISKGKEIKSETINIPDVSGKSVEEAKSILANAGVGVNPVKGEAAKSEGEAGKVYSQSQSGSLTIKQGEKVTITINYYQIVQVVLVVLVVLADLVVLVVLADLVVLDLLHDLSKLAGLLGKQTYYTRLYFVAKRDFLKSQHSGQCEVSLLVYLLSK